MATVEVLMPFYGDVALLKEAVASVLAQSDPHWRLVVVDDAYPDDTVPAWFDSLHDSRVEYHRNESNLGVTRNFNRLLEIATAELVTLMGCDDRMLPDYVARVLGTFADAPADVAMFQPGVRVVDAGGTPVLPLGDRMKNWLRPGVKGTRRVVGGEQLVASLLHGNWTYFPSICWRRSRIAAHGFRSELTVVQDLALLLDLATEGQQIVVDDDPVFEYRRHAAAVSSVGLVTGDRLAEERAFFEESAARFSAMEWPQATMAARLHFTSRLNALTRVPGAVRQNRPMVLGLVRHALCS